MSFYNAILALTGNDMLPKTNEMMLTASVILIAGAFYNAYIIGDLQNLFESLNRRTQAFVEKLDVANTSMKNMMIEEPV